jgi:hypothetical protein
LVAPAIEASANNETASVHRVRDEVDDRLVGRQRTASPVDRNEREQARLDLVPLAGSRREGADADRDSELVGEALELVLPDSRAISVAATRVGGDEDLARIGVAVRADLLSPRVDGRDREDTRVVIDADADEAIVGGDVVHAVGNGLADSVVREVVNVDLLHADRGPLASLDDHENSIAGSSILPYLSVTRSSA